MRAGNIPNLIDEAILPMQETNSYLLCKINTVKHKTMRENLNSLSRLFDPTH